jgi:hypothetical protein
MLTILGLIHDLDIWQLTLNLKQNSNDNKNTVVCSWIFRGEHVVERKCFFLLPRYITEILLKVALNANILVINLMGFLFFCFVFVCCFFCVFFLQWTKPVKLPKKEYLIVGYLRRYKLRLPESDPVLVPHKL